MGKIFLVLTLLVSGFGFTESKMIPLSKYMEDMDMSDPAVLFYVSARCGAINFNMADLSENRKELYGRGTKAGETFTEMAIMTRQVINPDDTPQENQKISIDTVSNIANEYVKVMNENYSKSGMYFTDWMVEDLSTCSSIYNSSLEE